MIMRQVQSKKVRVLKIMLRVMKNYCSENHKHLMCPFYLLMREMDCQQICKPSSLGNAKKRDDAEIICIFVRELAF